MKTAVVICGRTGSGKSTLAQSLAEKLGFSHISSGDIARDIARRDAHTRRGLQAGDWAPESAIRQEVLAQIEAAFIRSNGCVLDGFPRSVEQLILLESLDCRTLYFYMDVDELECIRRILQRNRSDDNPDAIALRLRSFREKTFPMLGVLRDHIVSLSGHKALQDNVVQIMQHVRRVTI